MEKYITQNGIKYELKGEQYYPMHRKPLTPKTQGKAFLSPTKQSRDKKKKEQKTCS